MIPTRLSERVLVQRTRGGIAISCSSGSAVVLTDDEVSALQSWLTAGHSDAVSPAKARMIRYPASGPPNRGAA